VQPIVRAPGQGRKHLTHAGSPRHNRLRRDGELRLATEARHNARHRPTAVAREASALRHCPVCGKGLSARFRQPGEVHLERISRRHLAQHHGGKKVRPAVCRWTP